MKSLFSRTLQTTIIFLIIGGIIALALGGYFSGASNVFTSSLVSVQAWFSSRFAAVQEFLTAPRDIATLRQRNTELEAEVSELQAQVIQLQHQPHDAKHVGVAADSGGVDR
jgi:rod shape-determining protein MreC